MKACVALSWRSARTGLPRCRPTRHNKTKYNRHYATKTSPLNPASPIVRESDGRDENLPQFHVNSETKTVSTAVGDLPLSPVMDPEYWKATTRYRTEKPKKGRPENSFERQFRRSPFAWALASPIRQCTASKRRLPSYFLQDFNIIGHPETGQPWWVPHSFARDDKKASRVDQEIEEDVDEFEKIAEELESCTKAEADAEAKAEAAAAEAETVAAADAEAAAEAEPNQETSEPKSLLGPTAWVLARQEMISSFAMHGSCYFRHYTHLFGTGSSRFSKLAPKAVWRLDMDTFIIERMREKIYDEITYLNNLDRTEKRKYIVKSESWADFEYEANSAILWFRGVGTAASDTDPGPFAVYETVKNKKLGAAAQPVSIPVYNMNMLLGDTYVERLRAVLGEGSLFVVSRKRTMGLKGELWKLQGYLAEFRDQDSYS